MNMGSFITKNTEWTRALMERIKDMRVVWHLSVLLPQRHR
jgi:hypothetical protein